MTAERIVSLVPSHTESLFDLGAGDRVVGRTRFCIAPEAAGEVPVVGGTKDAKLERILALEPDLVVADKDENPKALVDGLLEGGVDVLWSEIDTVPDAARFLRRLGETVGAAEQGGAAAEAVEAALAACRPTGILVPAFVPIWYRPWMTFDRCAYPHAMLEAVGIRNVFGDHAGPKYFEVGPEEVRGSGAAWTLLPTEPYPFHKRRASVDLSELGPAGERVRIIDGEALTWFGTRTVRGLHALAEVREGLGAGTEAGG